MIGLKSTPIVGLIACLIGLAIGIWTGAQFSDAKWQKIRARDAQQVVEVITVKEVQTQKCQAEVAKVNEATAEQATKTAKLIIADQAQRKVAEQRAVRRMEDYERRQTAAFATLDELRRQIDAGAFQGCANERVGDDIVRMLNGALAEAGDGP